MSPPVRIATLGAARATTARPGGMHVVHAASRPMNPRLAKRMVTLACNGQTVGGVDVWTLDDAKGVVLSPLGCTRCQAGLLSGRIQWGPRTGTIITPVWPERLGLTCSEVPRPADASTYPWWDLESTEVVVLIENDPLARDPHPHPEWSCVLNRADVRWDS